MKTNLPPPPRDYQKSHQLIGAWMHKHHLSCEHYTHLSISAMDRPLGISEKFHRWIHFFMCSVCRKFTKQIASLRMLVKRHASDLAATKPTDEFLQSLRKELASTTPENSSPNPKPDNSTDG